MLLRGSCRRWASRCGFAYSDSTQCSGYEEVHVKDPRILKLTNEQRLSNIREEYRSNIDLWVYDITFRNQRNGTFLNINTALLVALSILITISPSLLNISITGVLISLFGLMTCAMWRQIMLRNGAYINFRRYQLRNLEIQLQNVTTFGNQWRALNKYEPIAAPGLEDVFQISKPAKVSATNIESRVPLVLSSLWSLIFIAGITIIILSLFGIT